MHSRVLSGEFGTRNSKPHLSSPGDSPKCVCPSLDMNGRHETHFSSISNRPEAIFARARTRIPKIESASAMAAGGECTRMGGCGQHLKPKSKLLRVQRERNDGDGVCIYCISHETKESQGVHFVCAHDLRLIISFNNSITKVEVALRMNPG